MLEEFGAFVVSVIEAVWSYGASEWIVFRRCDAYVAVDILPEDEVCVVVEAV